MWRPCGAIFRTPPRGDFRAARDRFLGSTRGSNCHAALGLSSAVLGFRSRSLVLVLGSWALALESSWASAPFSLSLASIGSFLSSAAPCVALSTAWMLILDREEGADFGTCRTHWAQMQSVRLHSAKTQLLLPKLVVKWRPCPKPSRSSYCEVRREATANG